MMQGTTRAEPLSFRAIEGFCHFTLYGLVGKAGVRF